MWLQQSSAGLWLRFGTSLLISSLRENGKQEVLGQVTRFPSSEISMGELWKYKICSENKFSMLLNLRYVSDRR